MYKRTASFIFVAFFSALAFGTTFAYQVNTEFSATAIQKAPDRPEYQTKMYISKDSIRKDSVQNNMPVIEIVKLKQQSRIFLVPNEKIYMQITNPNPTDQGIQEISVSAKPCEGLPNTSCQMLGEEKVNQRDAEKWEFTATIEKQSYRSLHWVDKEHRMFIREFFPDGTISELVPDGVEKINGRNTEKWLWMLSGSDGKMQSATQWYDPELKIMIREELQGGYIRELRDVKTGKQDLKLFDIPSDYKQVESLKEYFSPQQDQPQE